MNPIHSIDDLKGAHDRDIKAAVEILNLRGRVIAGLKRLATEVGLTRAEYVAKVLAIEAEELDCRHCKGTGKWKRPKPRTIGVIHPSSADKCVLRLYYDVTGEFAPQPNFKPPLMFTFKIGHALHDLTQEILAEDLGTAFEPEKRIEIGTLVAGNTDGLITLPEVRAVLEIKSMGSAFTGLKEPKGEHRIQAGGLYATALDAPFTVYLYIDKAWPHDVKEYVEVYDPSIFRRWSRTKGERVQESLEEGSPPVADASPAECGECPYNKDCPQRLDKKGGKAFAVRK
jgi:CRISPR/Cas system-associated exonuclease Cas4 (RecB family)